MGIEITVNSLEEMCALMCDNVLPKRKEGVYEGRKRNGKDRKGDSERKATTAEKT